MSDQLTETPAPDESLQRIVDEQAALHRVARLVAEGADSLTVFNCVCEEAGRLIGATSLNLAQYTPDGFNVTTAGWSVRGIHLPVGTRLPLAPDTVGYWIQQTSAPARIDNYEDATSELAVLLRDSGIRSAVAAPVVVDGQLWGALAAGTDADEPLPVGTEERLARFTELVVIAIANAQSRDGLRELADEQAALRRVATLVARESSPVEIFGAVTEEARRVLASEAVGLLRFDPDGTASLVAQSDTPWEPPPLGTRFTLDGENVVTRVFRTAQTVRVDDWTDSTGAVAAMATVLGVRSAVASPVVVEGSLWGTIIAASSQAEPLPARTESRLVQFTALVATAIANAGARGQLARLAEEQAALRRIAVLVAQQPSPEEVFAAVTEAVAPLLGADLAAMHVFRADGVGTVVASWSQAGPTLPIGTELPLDGDSAVARIFRTGAAARIDGYADVEGETADVARGLRLRTTVGAPILVEGKLWGALMAATRGEEPLPEDAEARIAAFTELVATAVSNAQAREELHGLADEQGALRRVATLVAEEAPPVELFRAVAAEVGTLLGADFSGLARLADGTVIPLAGWASEGQHPPLPDRWPMQPGDPVTAIAEAQRAVRWDSWAGIAGPIATFIRDELRVRSTVGTPIVVEGRIWGVLAVHSRNPLPQDSESRLEQFSNLVATAIGNTDARGQIARLAQEQEALRRVATLVAVEASQNEIFDAVAEGVAGVLREELRLVRYEGDLAVVVAASEGPHVGVLPVGTRLPVGGNNALSHVFRTGKPIRIDDYAKASGPIAEAVQAKGLRSIVATPIVVEGRTWGAMIVGTFGEEPVPAGTEDQLGQFAELMATSIANTEARAEIERLAEQEAALRRVATLVAGGAPSAEVFEAVAAEVGALLDATDSTLVARYDEDEIATVIGRWSSGTSDGIPVGTRSTLGGDDVLTKVAETANPARVDDYSHASGEAAEIANRYGWRSAIGAPICVDNLLWGVMLVSTKRPEPFPAGAEARLESFTELLAIAISNSESRDARATLSAEQEALRRIATLVAGGADPGNVFAAVTEETAATFRAITVVIRFEHDPPENVIVGASKETGIPIGTRWPVLEGMASSVVYRTGRSARVGGIDWDGHPSPVIAEAGIRFGVTVQVSCPIIVGGTLWGVVIVNGGESLPGDTEQRLEKFTELVTTAIANTEARSEVQRLANEQAALRRIATLVARGVEPEQVFAAVAAETDAAYGATSAVVRFENDPPCLVVVAVSREADIAVGTRLPLADGMASTAIYRTGRPGRSGRHLLSGALAETARQLEVVSQIGAPVVVEGSVWGALMLLGREELPAGMEQRLERFTELVTTAISNAAARSALIESRARIVAAGDEARRRIERNLHDGTQQRLIALGLDIAAVRASVPEGERDLDANLERLEGEVDDVLGEVRELSRGLHPGLLVRQGLGPSLRALARRTPLPVSLEVDLPERPPEPVETATYFVVSEALTNAVKYAQASYLTVSISVGESHLHATIADDGVGGAELGAGVGSGLIGLLDRVSALGGRFELASPRGGGTTISIELPLAR